MDMRFADRFAQAWSQPTPEKLAALLHPEVLLRQPHRPPVRGRQAAIEDFRRLFAWLPALHGEVDRAAEEDGWVFIEWRMKATVGREVLVIPAVDRFRVENGVGIERVVYFDQLALAATLVRHPGLWPGYVRYLAGSLRR